jgi:hypothetical protein
MTTIEFVNVLCIVTLFFLILLSVITSIQARYKRGLITSLEQEIFLTLAVVVYGIVSLLAILEAVQ